MAEPPAGAALSPGALGALAVSALAVMGSPGPATISLVAAGSTHGVRPSLRYLAGIVAGTELVLVAVAGGVTAALLAVPALGSAVSAVSAAYILWLAYHVATAPPLGEAGAAPPPSLAGGLLLGVSNPKAWVAIAAVFSSVQLAAGAAADASAKAAVLGALIVVINGGWLVAGASLAPLLRDSGRARVANVTLAAALVGATALALLR